LCADGGMVIGFGPRRQKTFRSGLSSLLLAGGEVDSAFVEPAQSLMLLGGGVYGKTGVRFLPVPSVASAGLLLLKQGRASVGGVVVANGVRKKRLS